MLSEKTKRDGKGALQVAWRVLTRDPWPFEPEYVFARPRRWRFDWADVTTKVAIEVEGVVYGGQGRHQTAIGLAADCEKYNRALELGWVVVRLVPKMIKDNPVGVIEQIQEIRRQRTHG